MTLPRGIVSTRMCDTFSAPHRRPGDANGIRPETWTAQTADGAWLMERQEGEPYLRWALVYRPTDTLVTYAPNLRSCASMVERGSWTYREAAPNPYGRYEGPACVVMLWFRGPDLYRGVFGTVAEAIAWAQAGIATHRAAA